MDDTTISYTTLLSAVLLEVKNNYGNFNYKQEGLMFSIRTKGWLGKKIYQGVVETSGNITIDVLDQYNHKVMDNPSSKKILINSSRINKDIVDLGSCLNEHFVRLFHRNPTFNMVQKIN